LKYPKEQSYIATTGFFDGVHKGHVAVLNRLKQLGLELNSKVCVISFWPHPRIVLNKDAENLKLLSTIEEKEKYLKSLGIDKFIVIPFTKEFATLSSQQFISHIVDEYNISGLCVGYDHHVGKDRSAGFESIKNTCNEIGIYCEQVPPLIANDKIISSQKIRTCLLEGNIQEANNMLGYSYNLRGIVEHGQKLGRTIGFPTANIKLGNNLKLIPCNGVYAVKVYFENNCLKGMLYIGKKSTVNNSDKIFIEVNIFDFDDNLYDKEITISFEHFVRKDMTFANIEEMKQQLLKDKQSSLDMMAVI